MSQMSQNSCKATAELMANYYYQLLIAGVVNDHPQLNHEEHVDAITTVLKHSEGEFYAQTYKQMHGFFKNALSICIEDQ